MEYTNDTYEPTHSTDEGLNFGLYYCPICNQDTMHQVLGVEFDNYDIECKHCGTTSLTRADYFDLYEEESVHWGHEIAEFMGDDGEMYI